MQPPLVLYQIVHHPRCGRATGYKHDKARKWAIFYNYLQELLFCYNTVIHLIFQTFIIVGKITQIAPGAKDGIGILKHTFKDE